MKANQNFHQQDLEMFQMVNEKTALRRQRREAMEMAYIAELENPVQSRKDNLKVMGGAAARVSVGLVVLGGITRGLIDPTFAIAVAAGCGIWAWSYLRRLGNGNR